MHAARNTCLLSKGLAPFRSILSTSSRKIEKRRGKDRGGEEMREERRREERREERKEDRIGEEGGGAPPRSYPFPFGGMCGAIEFGQRENISETREEGKGEGSRHHPGHHPEVSSDSL